jgi:BirA family biotin operon repressor/biotin-[acetyl-CoA-carboxylase] ligase
MGRGMGVLSAASPENRHSLSPATVIRFARTCGIRHLLDMALDPIGTVDTPGWRVEVLDETISTNALAMARGEAGEADGYAVIADHQVGGRGRRGNRWESPPGSALLLSALFRPEVPLSRWPRVAVAAAVAVCRAITGTTSLLPSVKWPNDVLIGSHKVAGILIESRAPGAGSTGWLVVGVGINVHTREFPLTLRYPATSLALAGGHAPARAELACALLAALREESDRAFSDEGWPETRAAFSAFDGLTGRRIRAEQNGVITEGRAHGLDDEGGLILMQDDGAGRMVLRDAHSITPLD